MNVRRVLPFVVMLAACESNGGRDLCDELAFAAPSCAPPVCAWRDAADCDDVRASECVDVVSALYESATCADVADAQRRCDACR